MIREASSVAGGGRRYPGAAAVGWGLLFFACLQLALAVPMERGRPELRDLEYGTKRARLQARLAVAPGRPLFVVIGSSRANHGFHPGALPPLPAVRPPRGRPAAPPVVFNGSLMGSGPILQLLSLRRMLNDGVRPDWLLLEVWPPFLQQEGPRAEIRKIAVPRLGWRDLPVLAPYYPDPLALYQDWCVARLAPWSASRFILLEEFARDWLPREVRRDDQWAKIDPSGWLPYLNSGDPEVVRERLPRVHKTFRIALEQFRVSESADRALRESVALCRREGIAVGLLYLPESKVFQGWYPAAARAEADRYLDRLGRDCRVPLVNARDWSPDTDFADGFHLLPAGADAFSKKLGKVLPAFLRGEAALGLRETRAGRTLQ
jgi:hypothetical protein